MGIITGAYPMYLSEEYQFTKLVVENTHLTTHHGLVMMAVGKVCESYYMEKIAKIGKNIIVIFAENFKKYHL